MDETVHIIVAAEVVNTSCDVHQLAPVLDAAKVSTKAVPTQMLAMQANLQTDKGQMDYRKRK